MVFAVVTGSADLVNHPGLTSPEATSSLLWMEDDHEFPTSHEFIQPGLPSNDDAEGVGDTFGAPVWLPVKAESGPNPFGILSPRLGGLREDKGLNEGHTKSWSGGSDFFSTAAFERCGPGVSAWRNGGDFGRCKLTGSDSVVGLGDFEGLILAKWFTKLSKDCWIGVPVLTLRVPTPSLVGDALLGT